MIITDLDYKFELTNELTRPTARDKQRRIGPSDLGNPCAHCLSRKMLGENEGFGDFSLYPWIGTAVHSYLEQHVFQDVKKFMHEQRLYVGEVPGYGAINGTADLIERDTAVIDWKIVGIKKIAAYRAGGVPKQYRYQRQLYARGCELTGHPVKRVVNVFIPRDSGNVKDIWVDEEAYQPEMAERALLRAGDIYAEALLNGSDSIESDPSCYVCNLRW